MAEREPPAVTDDPRDWAPMRAYRGRRVFEISDPVLEPLWSGTRVLAHLRVVQGPEPRVAVELIEELGADLAPELPDLSQSMGASFMALEAVLDGVISRQITLDGVGASAIPEVRGRPTQMFVRSSIDFDVTARGPLVDAAAEAEPIDGFIAVDLLRVDGSNLLDVPLLERKRLLESVIRPSRLVRISQHVRPPIDTWLATWKAIGLRGGVLKAANSRYHPNDDTVEWSVLERLNQRR